MIQPQSNSLMMSHHIPHKQIFSSPQRQQSFNMSLQSDEAPLSQPFINKILKFFTNINLCLRPQMQSRQLGLFLQNYEVDSLYQDPYYGQCYALRSKELDVHKPNLNITKNIFNTTQEKEHFQRVASLRHYVSLSKQRLNKKEYKQRKQVLDEISRYSGQQQNVLRFTIISELQKQQFLFTNMQLYIAYDFILIDLEKEFQNRIIQKRPFTESQINIIMKEACSGLVALENTNYRSIRMAYIYFCQYGKEIKVAHPKMFNYKTNLETIAMNYHEKGIYLSPQELALLQKNQTQSNPKLNEMPNSFTFGMLVLSLMCNKYLDQVYDYRTCEIDFLQLNQLINNLANTFSERLVNIVTKLLKPKLHQRLTLRSLLNVLQEKYELTEHVEITLIKQHVTKEITQAERYSGYRPLFEQQPQQPRHKNYLYGMVYPKIGNQGEFYHQQSLDPFNKTQQINDFRETDAVIANYRYSYIEEGQLLSKYMGDSVIRNQLKEQPLKQGYGLYTLPDGQSYRGEWKNNQMHGYGKLSYPLGKLRYEGEFQNGMFNGFGTEYAYGQIPQRQMEIDKTFVRLNKGAWLKYEGRYRNDRRQGPGKAFFKNGVWIGNFKNDQPNGHGVWEGSDGDRLKGVWEDGCYIQGA